MQATPVITIINNATSINSFVKETNIILTRLNEDKSQETLIVFADYCVGNTFLDELPYFNRIFEASKQEVVKRIKMEQLDHEEAWRLSEKAQNYLSYSKNDIVNKNMQTNIKTHAFILIQQGYNLFLIHQALKIAKNNVQNEKLFTEIDMILDRLRYKVEQVEKAFEADDIDLIDDLKPELAELNMKAVIELSKIDNSLNLSLEMLNNSKNTSFSNAITNLMNASSSGYVLFSNFNLFNLGNKILGSLHTILFSAFAIQNAHDYCVSDKMLVELKEKQIELKKLEIQVDELSKEIRDIKKSIRDEKKIKSSQSSLYLMALE